MNSLRMSISVSSRRRKRGRDGGRRPFCPAQSAIHGLLALFLDRELVKMGLGVGLGPQADLARLVDAVVLDVEILLPIEEALDVVADVLDLQSMPFAGGNLHIGTLELLVAFAIH